MVERGASAPVSRAECGEADIADAGAPIPWEFDDVVKAAWDETSRAGGGDDGGVACRAASEARERGAIEVIEVGVRDENDVDVGEVFDIEGRGLHAGHTDRQAGEAHADAVGEDRVGEDGGVTEFEEDGGVTKPARGEGIAVE